MGRNKLVAFAGAAVGFSLFLAIALVPALTYGAYAGLLLAAGVFGAPVEPGFFTAGLMVLGVMLATFGTAGLFTVAGAAAASALANLWTLVRAPAAAARREHV